MPIVPTDYVKDTIVSIEATGEKVMNCWNGRRVTGDSGATYGEIVGDYWSGTNLTGATRMLLVAFPSCENAENVYSMRLDQVGFL
jgi:hypothetical protein